MERDQTAETALPQQRSKQSIAVLSGTGMRLCIPTLCRDDLLGRLIDSAEVGSIKPTEYYIIDNGGGLPLERFQHDLGMVTTGGVVLRGSHEGGVMHETPKAQILQPGRNLGVAASWNAFLSLREPVIICNDDILLKPEALETIARGLEHVSFVLGYGFALFGITPECVERVGYFDETFFPAYFEDCDYELRMRRAGIQYLKYEPGELAEHEGWATSHATDDRVILDAPEKNRQHFVAKWGGVTGHCSGGGGDPPLFAEPFSGTPPSGWARAQKCPPSPMRWDIVNAIAKKLGGTRYLEIGVADGESMRHVDMPVRHGVDPVPSPGGQRACTKYFPYSSRYFFEDIAPGDHMGKLAEYDIVFIDGDHRAELVYQEIEWALGVLSPTGVIVLHDCNPATEAMQTETYEGGLWNGTVWKAVVRIRHEAKHFLRVVNADYGVGILVPDAAPTEGYVVTLATSYKELEADRPGLLGIVSGWEWEKWFEGAIEERERRKGDGRG